MPFPLSAGPWWAVPLLLLLPLGFAPAARGSDERSPQVTAVRLGLAGGYKSGFWTPIRIELTGGSQPFRGDLEIVVPDSDGADTRFVWQDFPPVTVEPGASLTVTRIIKLGRAMAPLTIVLRDGETIVTRRSWSPAETDSPLASEREWIVAYGTGLDVAESLGRNSRVGRNTVVTVIQEPAELPDHWLGFEGVDTLVLGGSDPARLQALSPQQRSALRDWALMGGRVVWSVGRYGKELLGEGGALADFAPGSFREVAPLRNLGPLESYSGSVQRVELQEVARSGIPISVLDNPRGVVELMDTGSAGSRPLVIRTPFGLGQSVFAAFDLELPSVAEWDGRGRILARLLQPVTTQMDRRRDETTRTQVARFGYQDMVGQLRSGLDQFPGVRLVALWWVAALVSVYIVLIGPVDYFLLRDFVKRPAWTWITFPLVTLAFVFVVIWLGPRWKGGQVLINQVDLVDVDASRSLVRGTTWAHLYSPRAATYDVQAAPAAELADSLSLQGNLLTWQGLPGTGLGGFQTTAAAPPAIDEYQLAVAPLRTDRGSSDLVATREVTLKNVPVAVAATKSLLGRWWGEIELREGTRLTTDPDGLPRGEIMNPLPLELTDCVVYFGNWAFRLDATRGILAPGQKTRIEVERALNLHWRLTGRRIVDTKDVGTPWDQHTLEVPRIIEMMMFHSAAGGDSYTQLIHRYQPYVDLSRQLALGQAILIGRATRPAAQLTLGDSTARLADQWTFYRIVFPVEGRR